MNLAFILSIRLNFNFIYALPLRFYYAKITLCLRIFQSITSIMLRYSNLFYLQYALFRYQKIKNLINLFFLTELFLLKNLD